MKKQKKNRNIEEIVPVHQTDWMCDSLIKIITDK